MGAEIHAPGRRDADLLVVATGWPEYKEIDTKWCERKGSQRLTVLDLWRTLPADKYGETTKIVG